MVLRKDELEIRLKDEHQLIQDGVLRDDSPLDVSDEFQNLLYACRIGDLKGCQEAIATGVDINARDQFDYTPLILASLCGHFEVVKLLLESGALCERDTFQGERCIYNALNNRIRNLLLQYDYSKSTDPLQPFASHITSLLTRSTPKTSDICLTAGTEKWHLHKFVLSARSPYFNKKLTMAPNTTSWRLASTIPQEAFHVVLRYLYLGDVPSDLGITLNSSVTEEEVFKGIDKISKQLEIESLLDRILAGSDRRIARQRHQDEVARGRNQLEAWFRSNVLEYKLGVDTNKAQDVQWDRENSIFADVLLRADEDTDPKYLSGQETPKASSDHGQFNGIPIGPSTTSQSPSTTKGARRSVLFPVHRAILLRSEYFHTMFESSFREAQTTTEYLHIVKVDCTPEVLEIILAFLYTETANIPIEYALDVLFAADMLFIEKLKTKAAVVISTMGMGDVVGQAHNGALSGKEAEAEPINVYDVIRAGWFLNIQRLEVFSARYLAWRLEDYIDDEEFEELIKESASRIQKRQETDSIELLDDIRYYLSEERFRLAFEDSGIEEIMNENNELNNVIAQTFPVSSPASLDEAIDVNTSERLANETASKLLAEDQILTLSGEVVDDEFAAATINHNFLMSKIDILLEKLKLDA